VLIKIVGQEIDVLRGITAQVRSIMESVSGVVDIQDDFADAAPELHVQIDRAKAAAMGISLEALAYTLRGATAGLEIREFRDELDVSKKYDLKVRFSPESRTRPSVLDDVKLRAATGALVPCPPLHDFTRTRG
jgi:multidrug efflux pump subunit AcrB